MRVLLTGASGLLGRHVADALLAAGHELHAVDRIAMGRDLPPPSIAVRAELSSWDRLDAAVAGADAVVHLAAIPNLDSRPEEEVFASNVGLSARIAFAAIRAGNISRFIYASSQTVLGQALAPVSVAPDYLPVDEMHACRPSEGYGLSKKVGEELTALVASRLGIPAMAIRMPVIWAPETFDRHVARRSGDPLQAAKSLYAYVDARDAGAAFRLALEANWNGFEVVQIGADRPFSDDDVGELALRQYGPVERKSAISKDTPLWSIAHARRLLGYRPRYRWSVTGIADLLEAGPGAAAAAKGAAGVVEKLHEDMTA